MSVWAIKYGSYNLGWRNFEIIISISNSNPPAPTQTSTTTTLYSVSLYQQHSCEAETVSGGTNAKWTKPSVILLESDSSLTEHRLIDHRETTQEQLPNERRCEREERDRETEGKERERELERGK